MTVQNAEGTQGTNTEQAAGAGASAGAAGTGAAGTAAAGAGGQGAQGTQNAGAPGTGDDPVKLKRDFAAMTGQVSRVSRENATLKAEIERLKGGAAAGAGAAGTAANQGNQEQQGHEVAVERAVLLHVASTGTPLKPRVLELLVADAKRTLTPNADGKVEGVEALVEGFLGELKASLGGSTATGTAGAGAGAPNPNIPDPSRPSGQSGGLPQFEGVKTFKDFVRLPPKDQEAFEKAHPQRLADLRTAHRNKAAGVL